MKLEDFITMEEPWAYNFEFECGDEDYKRLETFKRYFIYKTQPAAPAWDLNNTAEFIKNNFGYRPVYDPDGWNKLAYYQIVIEIYRHLWNWNCAANPEQRKNEVEGNIFGSCPFGPDTMNSVQKPLSLYVGVKNYSLRKTIDICYDPNKDAVDITKNAVNKNINIVEVKHYIDWYHTLGNFVLIPEGFNGYRSDEFEDFWDLSLDYLKEKGFSNFEKCKFNKYINYFFLWDYVKHENSDYIVNTSISNRRCKSEQPFSSHFFDRTREIIKDRGQFMTAMLMIEQKDPDSYKEIQSWLVPKNDDDKLPFFNGMNDAAEKIMKEFGEKIPENAKGILKELSKLKTY